MPIFRYDETLPRGDERNKTPESRASLATTESLDHGTLALMDDVPDRSDIHPHTHATSVAYRPKTDGDDRQDSVKRSRLSQANNFLC